MPIAKSLTRTLKTGLLALAALSGATAAAQAEPYRIAYGIYAGYMPLAWMEKSGVLDKWAEKYGTDIEIVEINDYIGSITQFASGDIAGVALASMDGLTIPAAGGVDTTIVLAMDYSNGNDAILSKDANSIEELKGGTIGLIELSISHYFLSRALEMNGLSLKDVETVNISDADLGTAYVGSDELRHAVYWKPVTIEMNKAPGSKILFDSSAMPEELTDSLVFQTSFVEEHPEVVKALVGAWYEAVGVLSSGGPEAEEMIADMAALAGTTPESLKSQLATTEIYTTPDAALEVMNSDRYRENWDFVRTFSYNVGLFGENAPDKDFIGIEFPDGEVLGDPGNVTLRVNDTFTRMAAEGEL